MSPLHDESALAAALDAHRREGRRIVFTNGAFDLLHVGHVRMLEAARSLGDVLVVAINDDDSVRARKGAGRPVVPAIERAELLRALRAVDHVIVFSDRTVDRLLERLRPDVHAKGRDYDLASLPERATDERLGIRVAFVGDAKEHGSRDLLARIGRAAPPPVDRAERFVGSGVEGVVQRRRRETLRAGRWLDLSPFAVGKPGDFVEGNERRFVRRLEIDATTVYAKVTRPLEGRRSPVAEFHHLLALRAAGFVAPEPWLALEGKLEGERVGLLVTAAAEGPSLLAWLHDSPSFDARRLRADDVGRAIRALHTARFLHPDLMAWHLVLVGEPGRGVDSIAFLDVQRLRRGGKRLDRRAAMRGLVALDLSVRGLATERERLRVLRAWLGGSLARAQDWLPSIARLRKRLEDRSTFRAPPLPGRA